MKITKDNITLMAAGLGAVAGMRTTIAPAVLSHHLGKDPKTALAKSKLSFIQTPAAGIITKVLSAAEITADKLPAAPDRIIMPQTLARVLSGAFVGAVLFQATKESVAKGALIGGVCALASTYASFYIRKSMGKLPFMKNPILGALEDVLAFKSGLTVLER